MDLKSSSTSWIWAVRGGNALNTNDQSANLPEHSNMGAFKLDLTKAAGGSSLNPFQDATASSTTAAASGSTSGPDASSSGAPDSTGGSAGNDSGSGGDGEEGGSKAMTHRMVIAHGILMALAFVIFFPLGALTIRFLSVRHTIWIHAGAQVFAYSIAIAAFGLGVWIAVHTEQVRNPPPQFSLFPTTPSSVALPLTCKNPS